MASRPVYLAHQTSLAHDTGSHPEHASRIEALNAELERRDWLGYEHRLSPEVPRPSLYAVHPPDHVGAIERAAAAGGGALDPDTVISAGSFEAALYAAGGAVALAELLVGEGSGARGFSAHRPPGHHALPRRAMGFCLFNNVAVAARHALTELGLQRILILDWDVHHGNGTNDIFADSDRVLFVSIHQSPLYPGTGSAVDVGTGAGSGYTVNLPVPQGSGDEVFVALVDRVVVPIARSYQPELILISAGFDAHAADPLAGCTVTEAGFASMAASTSALSDELGVGLGCVLEGGYHLGALAASAAVTMSAIVGAGALHVATGAHASGDGSADAVVSAALGRLVRYWPALAPAGGKSGSKRTPSLGSVRK